MTLSTTARALSFLCLATVLATGCQAASCPAGETAVAGACFPDEAIEQVGSGTPVACAAICDGWTPHCDYTTGNCAECGLDRHCASDAASRCDRVTHTCTTCVSDDDCVHRAGRPYCDLTLGRCSECMPATEAIDCGGTSCDALSGRCTDTPLRSVAPCGRCRASSECPRYYECVEYTWGTGEPEHVCLLRFDDAGACAPQPYDWRAPMVLRATVQTLRGDSVEVCRPPTTCGAWEVYRDRKPCSATGECGGPFFATTCLIPDGATLGHCSMLCLDAKPNYAGCNGGDTCDDGIYCAPPLQ